MSEDRFDRNERLFGKDGQSRLKSCSIAIMGAGGLGSIVVAETALLGVGHIAVIDHEEIDNSNRNRYFGVWHDDPIPGSPKTAIAKRLIESIDPKINATDIFDNILSPAGLEVIKQADYVMGCVDNDGVRFVLNEACLAYDKILIDMATGTPEPRKFGGRIAVVHPDIASGCLVCDKGILDMHEVRQFLSPAEVNEAESAVYGVPTSALQDIGPSVVSLNGAVASLGVTTLMMLVTKIDEPPMRQEYRGYYGTVTRREVLTSNDCYYCHFVRGCGDLGNTPRYFAKPL